MIPQNGKCTCVRAMKKRLALTYEYSITLSTWISSADDKFKKSSFSMQIIFKWPQTTNTISMVKEVVRGNWTSQKQACGEIKYVDILLTRGRRSSANLTDQRHFQDKYSLSSFFTLMKIRKVQLSTSHVLKTTNLKQCINLQAAHRKFSLPFVYE